MVANFHNKMSALLQPQLRPLSCSVPSDELINSFVPAGNLGLQSYNKFESTFLNLFEAILQAVVIKKQSKATGCPKKLVTLFVKAIIFKPRIARGWYYTHFDGDPPRLETSTHTLH